MSSAAHHVHALDDAEEASAAHGTAPDLGTAPDHGAAPDDARGPLHGDQRGAETGRPGGGLTERELKMLALERGWWKYAGAKEQAIRDLFDLSATHYYQILNALIDTEDALAHDPMLVKRLRRLRTSRQRARTARRLGGGA